MELKGKLGLEFRHGAELRGLLSSEFRRGADFGVSWV